MYAKSDCQWNENIQLTYGHIQPTEYIHLTFYFILNPFKGQFSFNARSNSLSELFQMNYRDSPK